MLVHPSLSKETKGILSLLMAVLYSFSIFLFGLAIRVGALFSGKARRWNRGRRGLFSSIVEGLKDLPEERQARVVWFHIASLGEFEQGRPLMEKMREMHSQCVIVLTFFSPSGYEVRKNTPVADHVWYIPLDTPGNMRRFIRLVRPSMAFFVKYEFWYNALKELRRNEIPVFLVSAAFRPGQLFFRWYGGWFRRQLGNITWFFLQTGEAKTLLESHGIRNFSVTGDTRFDRVAAIASQPKEFPLVEKFCSGSPVLIGGSTWPEDEALLMPLIINRKVRLKYIIAPHEVHGSRIESLISAIRKTPGMPVGQHSIVRFSELTKGNAAKAKVLIVDSIGQLAYLYRYASFALIGGAFGAGLHNILEAVTFGKPVMFGPNYKKFTEANELIRLGGAMCVHDPEESRLFVKRLLSDPVHLNHMADVCRIYADSNRGATNRIFEAIRSFGFFPRAFTHASGH
jgi:3-deoxy-D-manno-octulosonic-acid transferase